MLPLRFEPLMSVEAFLEALRQKLGVPLQCVRQDGVASPLQLLLCGAQAYEAWRSGSSYAKKLEIEMLLRVAATSQFDEAVRRVGLRAGDSAAWLIAISGRKELPRPSPLARLLPASRVPRPPLDRLLKLYGVSREALEAYRLLLGLNAHDALSYHLCELAALELARR